jgi:hypothetical protein
VAVAATLFLAVQAAFMANIGRESEKKILLDAGERGGIALFAGLGFVSLVIAIGLLLAWLDRPRDMVVIGGGELRDAWLDQYGRHTDTSVLDLLAVRATQEEEEWAESNQDRKRALKYVGAASAVTVVFVLIELIKLYTSLT